MLLGVTSVICAKGVLESLVSRQVDDWFKDQPTIYTSQLSDAQKGSLFNELLEFAGEQGFVAIGRTAERLQSGAALSTFSVLPVPARTGVSVGSLAVLGTTVMDDALVESMWHAERSDRHARGPAGSARALQHEGGGPAPPGQARRSFTHFNQAGGPATLGQARRPSISLAYAQLSRAATFWPHFMPLVKHSQMFPPPE